RRRFPAALRAHDEIQVAVSVEIYRVGVEALERLRLRRMDVELCRDERARRVEARLPAPARVPNPVHAGELASAAALDASAQEVDEPVPIPVDQADRLDPTRNRQRLSVAQHGQVDAGE